MIQTRGSVAKKLKPGDRAVFTRTFTETDTMLFVGLSGDFNPHHTDAEFCALTRFGKPIVPGFLVAAMATHIGGQWAVLASQFHLDFLAPVYIGDTVTCEAELTNAPTTKMTKHVYTLDENGKASLQATINRGVKDNTLTLD